MNKWIFKHQVRLFFLYLHYPCSITGALLDTTYFSYLFNTFRWTTNDITALFQLQSCLGKCFWSGGLALRKIFRSILFKSIQSFFPFILHFMYCVQMIIYWKFCNDCFWWILKIRPEVSTPILEEEPLWPRIGHKRPVRYQYQDLIGYYGPPAATIANLHWDPHVLLQGTPQSSSTSKLTGTESGMNTKTTVETILKAIQGRTETWTNMPFLFLHLFKNKLIKRAIHKV